MNLKVFFHIVLFLFATVFETSVFALPRLLIKMPTRDRYEQFFTVLDQYYAQLSHQVPYHFVISCDLDDPVMNSEQAIKRLQSYPNLSYYFSYNSSKIEACNKDIDKHLDFDIILLASDDMIPVAKNYDLTIAYFMEFFFPNFDGVMHFNDGFQGIYLNTLPILGKKYYERFGYIYYPGYKSFYCDTEMTEVSRMLNKTVYSDQILIEHWHPSNGKMKNDALYERNVQYAAQDYELYYARRLNRFGLSPAEIVIPLFN